MAGGSWKLLTLFTFLSVLLSPALAWNGPLSTRGRYIIDADGNRFRIKGGNWHGGSGTWTGTGDPNVDANNHANETSHNMPLGLQYVPIDQIIDSFQELQINTIRLQWSNQMIHDTTIIQDDWVAANPQFQGMTCLQVYDQVVAALTARGIAVIINNHTNLSLWCCGVDGNERWNESQSDDTWADDWLFMVSRYAANKRVIGADLYNEVRRDILNDPNWGLGDDHDWYGNSQWLADRILNEANPDILVIVEGINWVGIPVDGFYHHRPTLEPVSSISHTLLSSNKLVYSAHFYDYTGPSASGATGIGETSDPRYRDFDHDDLFNVYTSQAGYVALDTDMHYTTPVWMSEFGLGRGSDDLQNTWLLNTIDYLVQNDLDFAFWPLVGYLGPNNTNGWALMNWNPSTGARDGLYDGNDGFRASAWNTLINATSATTAPTVNRWQMLNMDHGDFIQSKVMLSRGDWDSGAYKAACPDGLRLIGVSRGSSRGLCTDATYGDNMWASGNPTTTVYNESYVLNGDWASGYTKYECPPNNYMIGFAIRGAKVSTALCAQSTSTLGLGGSGTRWFDQGDNRGDTLGGDWANGTYKGQCSSDEYLAGIAFTTSIGSNGAPAAILCRQ